MAKLEIKSNPDFEFIPTQDLIVELLSRHSDMVITGTPSAAGQSRTLHTRGRYSCMLGMLDLARDTIKREERKLADEDPEGT